MNRSMARPLPRDPRPHRSLGASVRTGLVFGTVAAAINCLIWLIARGIGVPTTVFTVADDQLDTSLTPLIVIAATLFASLVAGLFVGLLSRSVSHAVRWIIVCGALFTLASLSAPLNRPEAITTATRVILVIMHVVTGVVVTAGLARGIWTDDRAVRT